MSVRHKAPKKCNCGRTVSEGSVFCSRCRAEIQKKNVNTMKNEKNRFHREMRGKGR